MITKFNTYKMHKRCSNNVNFNEENDEKYRKKMIVCDDVLIFNLPVIYEQDKTQIINVTCQKYNYVLPS